MLPFFFHIDTFALVSTIVTGIGTTATLPSVDCNGMETRTCTRVFEQIIAEEKAAGRPVPSVDCEGADAKRCADTAAGLSPE